MKSISIAHKRIASDAPVFVVAELSGNHQQDYDRAEKMIIAAAQAGVDAIKLQTYTADTMTLEIHQDEFMIYEEKSLWQGNSLHQLYQQAATPWEWHKDLFAKAESLGLIAFSSPFDASSVDFLENLNVPCYKIASFENNDLPLIKKVADTGKPIILSTGMASIEEIDEALETIYECGNDQVILLKCTSNYPALLSDANLTTINDMQQRFSTLVGLSDHSQGLQVAITATALGACFVEKHFVLDRSLGGVDAQFSLEPREFKQLVESIKQVKESLGHIKYGGSANEQSEKKYRRSVYCSKDIKKGECFTIDNIKIIRPGFGLPPKFYQQLINQPAQQDILRGTAISWSHVK